MVNGVFGSGFWNSMTIVDRPETVGQLGFECLRQLIRIVISSSLLPCYTRPEFRLTPLKEGVAASFGGHFGGNSERDSCGCPQPDLLALCLPINHPNPPDGRRSRPSTIAFSEREACPWGTTELCVLEMCGGRFRSCGLPGNQDYRWLLVVIKVFSKFRYNLHRENLTNVTRGA